MFGFLLFAVGVAVVSVLFGRDKKPSATTAQTFSAPKRNLSVAEIKAHLARNQQDVASVNDKIEELELKLRQDGVLREHDAEKKESLKAQQVSLLGTQRDLYVERDVFLLAQAHDVKITPETRALLEQLIGQAPLNKDCSRCNMPLYLTKANEFDSLSTYAWACAGFWRAEQNGSRCKTWLPLSQDDLMKLSVRIDNSQRDLIKDDALRRMIMDPGDARRITKVIGNHFGERVTDILCPVHREFLVIYRKRGADSLLDTFFLRCGRGMCGYHSNIRTAGQLALVYRTITGESILR